MTLLHGLRAAAAITLSAMTGGEPRGAPPTAGASNALFECRKLQTGDQTDRWYYQCRVEGKRPSECWSCVQRGMTAYLDEFKASEWTDPRPLRAGRRFLRRYLADLSAVQAQECEQDAQGWSHGACAMYYDDFALANAPAPKPDWWAELRLGEQRAEERRALDAADRLEEAFDICDRGHRKDPEVCLPLARASLEQRLAGLEPQSDKNRRALDGGLALLDRVFRTLGRQCQPGPGALPELCELRITYLSLSGESYLDAERHRESADALEDAYKTCTLTTPNTTTCWLTHGRRSWRARQRELRWPGAPESVQLNKAKDLLEYFVREDMRRTCVDAGLPEAVTAACKDLESLAVIAAPPAESSATDASSPAHPRPVFLAAVISPGAVAEVASSCVKRTASASACWPAVHAAVLDRAETVRDAPLSSQPMMRERLAHDLAAYAEAAGLNCRDEDAAAPACVHARLAAEPRVPTPVQQPRRDGPEPKPTPSRRERSKTNAYTTAGATSLAIGGVALLVMAGGMYAGDQAEQTGEKTRWMNASPGAAELREQEWFRRGELANHMVIAGGITAGVAIVAGVIVLAVRGAKRRERRQRLRTSMHGLEATF